MKLAYNDALRDCNQAIQLSHDYHHIQSLPGTFKASIKWAYLNSRSPLYILRGVIYGFIGENEKSIDDYTTAIKITSDSAEAFLMRANSYAEKGDFKSAVQDVNHAIELSPDDIEAYFHRARIHTLNSNFELALRDMNLVIIKQPDSCEALCNKAYINKLNGALYEALDDYNAALKINSEFNGAYIKRAKVYEMLSYLDKCEADYISVLTIDPNIEEAKQGLERVRNKKMQSENVIKFRSEPINKNEGYLINFYRIRGAAFEHLCRFEEAVKDYTTVIDSNSLISHDLYSRGKVLFKKGVLMRRYLI